MFIHPHKFMEINLKQNDDQFKLLYDQAEKLPNVNYIGYKPNEFIKESMPKYDMFVYPSILKRHVVYQL